MSEIDGVVVYVLVNYAPGIWQRITISIARCDFTFCQSSVSFTPTQAA